MPRDGATASEEPEVVDTDVPEVIEAVNLHRRWKTFKSELAESAKMDSQTPQMRMAYAQCLVIELLEQDPEIVASNIHKPLFDIWMAMHDLSLGGKPPVLFEADRPDGVGVTKPLMTFAHYPQGFCAAAYAALVNPPVLENPRRDGLKPIKARKLLDKMLGERNLSDQVKGIDLQAWFYQIGAHTAAAPLIETFQSCKAVLSKLRNSAEAAAYARQSLDMVARMQLPSLKLRHPSS